MDFTERSTRVYRTKQLYTKEELAAREALCVHEQPAFCAAACPLRLDARELLALAAKGDLTGARAMLERAAPSRPSSPRAARPRAGPPAA